mmetsp:Transcript_32431/g.89437  ORF Transcript_32431/g.89437 Transcript_32431/m.89437 type:complete len:225 (-) Transcript_32431:195-869(-)
MDGTSCVVLDADGQVRRVVHVVVLRIEGNDGCVFVELGELKEGGAVKPCCRLPGRKHCPGEAASEALEQLLERLCLSRDRADFTRTEELVECRHSTDVGMRTQYRRTVHHVTLREGGSAMPIHVHPAIGRRPSKGSRRGSLGSLFSGRTSLGSLGRAPVKLFSQMDRHTGRTAIYAWLPSDQFEQMANTASEIDLHTMLAAATRAQHEECSAAAVEELQPAPCV